MIPLILILSLVQLIWLVEINHQQRKIMSTQAELAAALRAVNAQLQKAIEEIVAAVANSGNTTPEVDAAVAALQAAAQALDDLNPDAP